eukprot:TRINITY_DN27122_c0_g1_i2.p1 TRINITY_DN27122_c0_g1~~TRINITY_DN27122_c0_g1_i2.p1  ORF type:complete len:148 (+),score=6.53 TRINITY_DN27122_c0_g1_i2:195-638(+)
MYLLVLCWEWIKNLICYTLPHQYKCFVSVYEILTAETCGKLSECIFKCPLLNVYHHCITIRGPGSRSGVATHKNSEVKHAWVGALPDGWQPGKSLSVHMNHAELVGDVTVGIKAEDNSTSGGGECETPPIHDHRSGLPKVGLLRVLP